MSAAAETYLDLDDGPLDADDDAPPGPSIMLRRGEAEQWLDVVFGTRAGYVAVACGYRPHRTAKGEYGHRRWHEARYAWPTQRNTLLTDAAGLLADADSGGPLVDVYVCPHMRGTDGRDAHTSMKRPGNALLTVALHADLDGPPAEPELWAKLDPLRVQSGTPGHEHGLGCWPSRATWTAGISSSVRCGTGSAAAPTRRSRTMICCACPARSTASQPRRGPGSPPATRHRSRCSPAGAGGRGPCPSSPSCSAWT